MRRLVWLGLIAASLSMAGCLQTADNDEERSEIENRVERAEAEAAQGRQRIAELEQRSARLEVEAATADDDKLSEIAQRLDVLDELRAEWERSVAASAQLQNELQAKLDLIPADAEAWRKLVGGAGAGLQVGSGFFGPFSGLADQIGEELSLIAAGGGIAYATRQRKKRKQAETEADTGRRTIRAVNKANGKLGGVRLSDPEVQDAIEDAGGDREYLRRTGY